MFLNKYRHCQCGLRQWSKCSTCKKSVCWCCSAIRNIMRKDEEKSCKDCLQIELPGVEICAIKPGTVRYNWGREYSIAYWTKINRAFPR